jgi:hypothetical protein
MIDGGNKMIRRLMIIGLLCLLFPGCSKNYYPWTDSKLPDWVMNSLKDDSKVLVELADSGPVNKVKPVLWCYKYKEVVIIYKLDKSDNIWKSTVWKR